MIQEKDIMVATDQFFNPTHVNDVVAMTIYIQEKNKYGLFNLCHPDRYSRYEIAVKLAKALGVSSSLIKGMPLHSIQDMEKRPLNTSIINSNIFSEFQDSFLSIERAV